jgi:hypothetical protein
MKPGLGDLSYREVLDHYALILCSDPATCKRAFSVHQHERGTYDGMGHIHWSRADTRVTRRGLRSLLVAVAGVMLKHSTRRLPDWERLYEANLWAWKEGIQTWRIQFTQEMSKEDRLRAYRQASRLGVPVRVVNFPAYQWMRGRRKNWHEGHSSSGSRSSVTSPTSLATSSRRRPDASTSLRQSA